MKGPTGQRYPHTSNRAELRAIIAALQFRPWDREQFKRIVIATDSSYAVSGATEWVFVWLNNGWRTSKGEPVKNRDLWELLVKEVKGFQKKGVRVLFWQIPRELNAEADRLAKRAAASGEVQEDFEKIEGFLC